MSENASLTRCRSVTRRLYMRIRKAAITTMIAKTMSHPSDIATPPAVILRCPYSSGNRPGTAEGRPAWGRPPRRRDNARRSEAERVTGAARGAGGVAVLGIASHLGEWVAGTRYVADRAGCRRVFVIEGAMEVGAVRAALADAGVAVLPQAAGAGPGQVDDGVGDQGWWLTTAPAAVSDRALQAGLAAGGAADIEAG